MRPEIEENPVLVIAMGADGNQFLELLLKLSILGTLIVILTDLLGEEDLFGDGGDGSAMLAIALLIEVFQDAVRLLDLQTENHEVLLGNTGEIRDQFRYGGR